MQYPHCDPRVLHAPGDCKYCDSLPELQNLRKTWQIAFTGQEPVKLPEVDRWKCRDAVLPCPADLIRGDKHKLWGGNVASAPTGDSNAG